MAPEAGCVIRLTASSREEIFVEREASALALRLFRRSGAHLGPSRPRYTNLKRAGPAQLRAGCPSTVGLEARHEPPISAAVPTVPSRAGCDTGLLRVRFLRRLERGLTAEVLRGLTRGRAAVREARATLLRDRPSGASLGSSLAVRLQESRRARSSSAHCAGGPLALLRRTRRRPPVRRPEGSVQVIESSSQAWSCDGTSSDDAEGDLQLRRVLMCARSETGDDARPGPGVVASCSTGDRERVVSGAACSRSPSVFADAFHQRAAGVTRPRRWSSPRSPPAGARALRLRPES